MQKAFRFGQKLFSVTSVSLVLTQAAFAATSNTVATQEANVYNPALVGQRFSTPGSVLPTKVTAPIDKTSKEPPAIPGADKIKFVLNQVIVQNATVFTPAQLEAGFKPYYHKEITLSQLLNLVTDVTNKYRNDGYILTKAVIPPQHIKNGIVTVKIVEGFVEKATVQGKPGRAAPLLQAFANKVTQDKPMQIKNLERYTLLANDIPGSDVKAVLTPSATTPGGADLTYVADQSIGQAFVVYDNYGTRYLGPQEFTIGGSLNSMIRAGDVTSLQAVTTSQTHELKFAQLTHDTPIGTDGARLNFGGTYTETQPGSVLEPFEIQGRSKSAFTGFSYPIIRSRSENLMVHSSFTYMDSRSTQLSELAYDDKVRYLRVGGNFDRADQYYGINSGGLDYEHGFNILGASNSSDLISRPEANPSYTKIMAQVSRLQGLGGRFSFFLASQGQYSFSPLFSAQQFAYGGPDYGRGYDPAEIVGDSGIAGKAELRVDTTPDIRFLKAIQYYAFYDAGEVWNIEDSGQPKKISAVSTGLGVRFNFTKNLNGNFYVAQPLTKKVSAQEAVNENSKSPRTYFQIAANI